MKYKIDSIRERGLMSSTNDLVTSFMSKLQLKDDEEQTIHSFIRIYNYNYRDVSLDEANHYAVCMPIGSTELLAVCVIETNFTHIEVKNIAYCDDFCVSIFLSDMASYLMEYRNVPVILSCGNDDLYRILINLRTTVNGERIPIFEKRICDNRISCIEETNIPWNNEWEHVFVCDINTEDKLIVIDDIIKQEKF